MEFKEWLCTCTKSNGEALKPRSIEHYESGFRIISDEALALKIIDKPLDQMDIYEYDLALCLLNESDYFKNKNDKGNNMYSNALKRYRCYLHLNNDRTLYEEKEVKKIINDEKITTTERESIIKSRVGQGIFRKKLMKRYNSHCIVTQTDITNVLVASHIKPWAMCNNKERLDVDNGLLLSATYDRLFDSGLITFTKKGKIRISSLVSKENIKFLNINNKISYDIKYNSNMEKYLNYHFDNVFIR